MRRRAIIFTTWVALAISYGAAWGQTTKVSQQDKQVYSNYAMLVKSGLFKWRWQLSPVIANLPANTSVTVLGSKEAGDKAFWLNVQYTDLARGGNVTGWVFCGATLDNCP